MHSTRSIVDNVFYKNITVTDFENESLEEAALREAYIQKRARRIIELVPDIYGVEDNTISMEYIKGNTLEKILPSLNVEQIDSIIDNVIEKNYLLNNNGIYHNDLILSNIYIDMENEVWLIDFGQAEFITGQEFITADVLDLRHIDEISRLATDLRENMLRITEYPELYLKDIQADWIYSDIMPKLLKTNITIL